MLEARIQQLQSDVVLDVQCAKVRFVKAPSHGRGVSSGTGPRSTPQEKSGLLKSEQTVVKSAFKSQPSRWIEKLTQEKNNRHKRNQNLQRKMETGVGKKPTTTSKSTKSSLMPTGTTHKTISTNVQKGRGHLKLSDETHAAVSSTAAAGAAATPHKVSKKKRTDSKNQTLKKEGEEQSDFDPHGTSEELAKVEQLEKRLEKEVSHWTSSSKPQGMQEGSEGSAYHDIQHSISSYLEACIFAGDFERAHRFLLSQHRKLGRRKYLNTDIYNIMMRLWAKKVSSETKFRTPKSKTK